MRLSFAHKQWRSSGSLRRGRSNTVRPHFGGGVGGTLGLKVRCLAVEWLMPKQVGSKWHTFAAISHFQLIHQTLSYSFFVFVSRKLFLLKLFCRLACCAWEQQCSPPPLVTPLRTSYCNSSRPSNDKIQLVADIRKTLLTYMAAYLVQLP